MAYVLQPSSNPGFNHNTEKVNNFSFFIQHNFACDSRSPIGVAQNIVPNAFAVTLVKTRMVRISTN